MSVLTMPNLTWWSEFIPNQAIVYDIGANVGDTVRECAPHAKWVYAFEPNPKCFQELRRHTTDLNNISLINIGLSNRVYESNVFTYRHWLLLPVDLADVRYQNPDYHPGQPTHLKGEFLAKFTTLDTCVQCFGTPDFIKIDVDGMEWAVLDGARTVLHDHRPILYLELGVYSVQQRGDDARNLTALLRQCGYDFVIDSYGRPLRATERLLLTCADGFDHDCNVLCVPHGDPRLDQWPVPSGDFE
jgi:FkbM family methyltransferase